MDRSDTASSTSTPRLAWRSGRAIALFLIIAGVVLAGDLVLKYAAFEHVAGVPVDPRLGRAAIPDHDHITLIQSVLALKLVLNEGAVFGIGQGQRWLLIGIGIIAAMAVGVAFARSHASRTWMHIALGLVLAGAIGNLYDRIVYERVRDMLYLFPGVELPFGWRWPGGSDELYPWIFNIADVALLLGLAILVVILYRHDTRSQAPTRQRPV